MTEKDWELKAREFNKRVLDIFPNFEFSNSGCFSVNGNNTTVSKV